MDKGVGAVFVDGADPEAALVDGEGEGAVAIGGGGVRGGPALDEGGLSGDAG